MKFGTVEYFEEKLREYEYKDRPWALIGIIESCAKYGEMEHIKNALSAFNIVNAGVIEFYE